MLDEIFNKENLNIKNLRNKIENNTTYLKRKMTKIYKNSKLVFKLYDTVANDSIKLYRDIILKNRTKPIKLIKIEHKKIDIDETTSIIYNPIENKYIYISSAPPIKNLVISGGGAKGIILAGVLKAFEEHKNGDFIAEIDNIAGSSVGAVVAAFISSGIKADDLINALSNADFPALLGHSKIPVYKDGLPLMNFVRTNMKTAILKRAAELDLTDQTKRVQLQNIVQAISDEAPLTFSMLQSLHEIDPAAFKSLTVTATCRETGDTFYFNAKNTPNMDIVTAVRASSSLPIILKPVKIDREQLLPGYSLVKPNKNALTFTDGGCFKNIPVDVMQDTQGQTAENRGEKGQNLQTLALVFDETTTPGEEQSPFLDHKVEPHTLYDSTKLSEKFLRDILGKYLGGIKTSKKLTKMKEDGLEEIRLNYTQRHIPLKIPLKTTDFKKAKKQEKMYIQKGYEQGQEYLDMHEGELFYRSFDHLEDLLKQLPEEKKETTHQLLPQLKKMAGG
jgi:predicted acylesterase/phospholipase RssA